MDHTIMKQSDLYQRLDLEKVGNLFSIVSQSDDDAGVGRRRSVVAIEIAKFSLLSSDVKQSPPLNHRPIECVSYQDG
jgi:hypothetical protein